jgi:hypothetical protein
MPGRDYETPRFWVQVREPPPEAEAAATGAIVGTFIASRVGAMVKAAGDRLVQSDQYALSSVLAYEPAFRAGPAQFLPRSMVLNVGSAPVPRAPVRCYR